MSDSLQMQQVRHIAIEGARNIRDLGGYPTADGKITKWGKYYRGDSLHQMPLESRNQLFSRGLRSIVDLRFTSEGEYQDLDNLQFQYVNIPLLDPVTFDRDIPASLVEMYCDILETSKPQIRQTIQHFIESGDNPVLFHCKLGKDRTGVIAALLLDFAGVPHNIIAEDYALTSRYHPVSEEAIKRRPANLEKEEYTMLLQCQPEYMHEFLEYLKKHHQNAENYLHKIGFQQEELDILQKHFVQELE